jgi:hypothetical protein
MSNVKIRPLMILLIVLLGNGVVCRLTWNKILSSVNRLINTSLCLLNWTTSLAAAIRVFALFLSRQFDVADTAYEAERKLFLIDAAED